MSGVETPALFSRFRIPGNPLANPDAVVTSGKARFTVLTQRLLRLEWSETGQFEDRGSFAFPDRHADAPQFTTTEQDGQLVIDTGLLRLTYTPSDGPFTDDNLSITFDLNGQQIKW